MPEAPSHEGSACPNEDAPPHAIEPRGSDRRRAVVLLVEDDVLIRMDAVDMLRGLGHEVVEAEYGPDALSVLQERHVDVLVTDVGLPGMSGTELASSARVLQPGIGLVFATGDTELEHREGRRPRSVVLCKPYDAASLADSLRRVLVRPQEPARHK